MLSPASLLAPPRSSEAAAASISRRVAGTLSKSTRRGNRRSFVNGPSTITPDLRTPLNYPAIRPPWLGCRCLRASPDSWTNLSPALGPELALLVSETIWSIPAFPLVRTSRVNFRCPDSCFCFFASVQSRRWADSPYDQQPTQQGVTGAHGFCPQLCDYAGEFKTHVVKRHVPLGTLNGQVL